MGTVANLYVDEDSRQLRFVDVVTSDFLGLERKHHLLPVKVVSEEDPGWITLGVDQNTVESAPTFSNPHVVPDEEYQRTIREHYGYGWKMPDLPRTFRFWVVGQARERAGAWQPRPLQQESLG